MAVAPQARRSLGVAVDVPPWLQELIGPGAVAAVLGFFGLKALSRIDALEKGKADKSDLDKLIDEMRSDRQLAREDNQAARDSRAKMYEKVNSMAVTLGRLEERIGKG